MAATFDAYGADLIRYVLRRGGPTARAELVKLLFLIDGELYRRFGSTVFRWKVHKYGPFSPEVLDVLDDMEACGSVVAKVADDDIIYEPASTAPAALPQEVREAADRILDAWAHGNLDGLPTHARIQEAGEEPPSGVAGEPAAAVGLGALAEELFFAHRADELARPYRRLREVRLKILQEVEGKAGEDVAEIVSNAATAIKRHEAEIDETLAELRRLGADPVKACLESAVAEYAEVLRLDVPVGGGRTLEDLLYERRDEVLDKLHEAMIALYMEYVEIDETCGRRCPPEAVQRLEKLATLELATYATYKLFQRRKIDGKTAAAALGKATDEILS